MSDHTHFNSSNQPHSTRYGSKFQAILNSAKSSGKSLEVSAYERRRVTASVLYKMRKSSSVRNDRKIKETINSLGGNTLCVLIKSIFNTHILPSINKFPQVLINSLEEILALIKKIAEFNHTYNQGQSNMANDSFTYYSRLYNEQYGENLTKRNFSDIIKNDAMELMGDNIDFLPCYMQIATVFMKIDSRKFKQSYLHRLAAFIMTLVKCLLGDHNNKAIHDFTESFIANIDELEKEKALAKQIKMAKEETPSDYDDDDDAQNDDDEYHDAKNDDDEYHEAQNDDEDNVNNYPPQDNRMSDSN